MWFLQQLEPHSCAFNRLVVFDIRGPFDPDIFREALAEVVRRHEILRTTYTSRGAEPVQVIHPPGPLLWEEGDGEQAALEFAHRAVNTPFDIEEAPPMRQGLFRASGGHYMFVSVRHHILTDAWSDGIFERELSAQYRIHRTGAEPLPPVAQYADYSVWDAASVNTGAARALDYWTSQLAGTPLVLELPADFPRPPAQTYAGDNLWHGFGEQVSQPARALARKLDTTPFRLLLAAFETLLFRYTGLSSFVVGVPFAGRTRPGLDHIHGCFVRTLPMRASIDPSEPFAELVKRTSSDTSEAFRYQELPFADLIKRLDFERDLSRSPVCQVMFSYWNAPKHQLAFDGCEVSARRISSMASMMDLTVYIDDSGPETVARFEYSTGLYSRARIERMAAHFTALLADACARPETPVSRLDLIPPNERSSILARSRKASPVPHTTVHRWFKHNAENRPGAVAIRFRSDLVTFDSLAAMANRVSAWLQSRGAGHGDRVAVRMERSPAMIAALLGVHQCGAAYVPLDPALPAQRADLILSDCGARAVLSDSDWPAIEHLPADPPGSDPATGEDLAYVIYTSGSTGRPKGVELPHRALVNIVESFRADPGFTEADTLLAVTTLSFDIAALEIFLPLCAGGTVALATREQAADPARLSQLIESAGVTVLQATPATWRMLVESGWSGCPRLRAWCGGEALRRDLADSLLPKVGELWNVYGPTETAIWSTLSRVTAGTGDPPIGRACANTSLLVLDSFGQIVPEGIPGELYIGGAGLARGYVNLPELTASRFIIREGQRYYRTGDLVQWTETGELRYLRRLDTQVKIRGYRIELGEVQAVLSRHESVAQCVVVVREDRPGDQRLVAYYVARGADPGESALAGLCREFLPGYMIPAAFVPMTAFPLNPSGKVDIKALPPPVFRADEPPAGEASAATPVEQRIRAIWRNVLGVARIAPGANFFDLGGHSLLAASMFASLESEFGVEIPLVNLFKHPTVEGLATLVEEQSATVAWSSVVPIKPSGGRPPLFYASRLHALACRFMVPYLDPEQPVYGLEPPGMDGGEPLGSVEELAAHYVSAVKSVQPAGPYLLCGHSFGGHITFEMARQLEAAGDKVKRLILLDCTPYLLPSHRASLGRYRLLRRRVRFHLRRAAFAVGSIWDPSRRGKEVDLAGRPSHHIDAMLDQLREDEARYGETAKRVGNAQVIAFRRYRPGAISGDITLLRIDANGPRFDELGGWQDLTTGRVEVHVVPGGHISMLREPHVRETATLIRRLCED